jgi:cyanophycinase-like exopeptidase
MVGSVADLAAARPEMPEGLVTYRSGNPEDAAVAPAGGPALLLMGGGREVTSAFRDRAFPILNGGDIVVLRASGSDGYNAYFLDEIGAPPHLRPNSVESIVLRDRDHANSDYVVHALDHAEMIWFAGGNQSNYLDFWVGTGTQTAVQRAWERGAVIGGTSAGLAIAGEFVYAPLGEGSARSEIVLRDPYDSSIQISNAFLDTPWLKGTITDSHYRERDRLGRSLAFMARLRADGRADRIRMIGISERTSLFIGPDGTGVVDGRDAAYIIDETDSTRLEQVAPGQPLAYTGLVRWRLAEGDTFDFRTSTSSVAAMPLSVDARRTDSPLDPADPYQNWPPAVDTAE